MEETKQQQTGNAPERESLQTPNITPDDLDQPAQKAGFELGQTKSDDTDSEGPIFMEGDPFKVKEKKEKAERLKSEAESESHLSGEKRESEPGDKMEVTVKGEPEEEKTPETEEEEYVSTLPQIDLPDGEEIGEINSEAVARQIKRFGGDPEKADNSARQIAQAYLHSQREHSRRSNEIKELRDQIREYEEYLETLQKDEGEETPAERDQVAAEKPNGRDTRVDLTGAYSKVEEGDIKGAFEDLLTVAETTIGSKLMQQFEDRFAAEKTEREKMRQDALKREVFDHNTKAVDDRARELLSMAAKSKGNDNLAKRYEDPNYQLTETDYNAVKPRLEAEWNYVQDNYNLSGSKGKVDLSHFRKAERELDPAAWEHRIRLEERRNVLAQIKKAKPDETIKPGAKPVASTGSRKFEIDPLKDRFDYAKEAANMTDEEIQEARRQLYGL